jgi:hypothetical protein
VTTNRAGAYCASLRSFKWLGRYGHTYRQVDQPVETPPERVLPDCDDSELPMTDERPPADESPREEAPTPEPAKTDHPTGEGQAAENAENEPAG